MNTFAESGETVEATFCFVDIAGYTALTDSHGEFAAADLVRDFGDLLDAAVADAGNVHELTGDNALIVFPGPSEGIAALATLFRMISNQKNFPVVRAGLHHGSALLRQGRYFGTTINLAARVAAQAKGGQLLCTEPIARMLMLDSKKSDLAAEYLGKAALRNLPESIDLYEIISSTFSRGHVIDPVCKMQIDKREAAGELQYESRKYWFCSLTCVERFARSPSSYL